MIMSTNGRDHGVASIDCPFGKTRYATPVHRMVRTISELILHKSRPPRRAEAYHRDNVSDGSRQLS